MNNKTQTYQITIIKTFIVNMIFYAKNIITPPVIAYALGINATGGFQQTIASISMLLALALLGLDVALIRFSPEKDKTKDNGAFFSLLLVMLTASFFLVLLYCASTPFLISHLYENNPAYKNIILCSSLLIISEPLYLYITGYFRAHILTKHYNCFQIIYSSSYILNTFCVFLHKSISILFIVQFIFTMILCLYGFLFIIKKDILLRIDFSFIKRALRYVLPLVIYPIATWIISSSDVYFITAFGGLSDTGIYSTCYTLSMVIMLIYSPFYVYLLPKFKTYVAQKNQASLEKLFEMTILYPLYISIPITCCIFAFSDEIVGLLTNTALTHDKQPLMLTLLIAYMFYCTANMYTTTHHLNDKNWHILTSNIIATIVNLIGNYFLIKEYGILGAGLSTLISFVALFVYMKFPTKQYNYGTPKLKKLALSIAVSGSITCMTLLCKPYFFSENSILSLAISILILMSILFACQIKLKIIDIEEIKNANL